MGGARPFHGTPGGSGADTESAALMEVFLALLARQHERSLSAELCVALDRYLTALIPPARSSLNVKKPSKASAMSPSRKNESTSADDIAQLPFQP